LRRGRHGKDRASALSPLSLFHSQLPFAPTCYGPIRAVRQQRMVTEHGADLQRSLVDSLAYLRRARPARRRFAGPYADRCPSRPTQALRSRRHPSSAFAADSRSHDRGDERTPPYRASVGIRCQLQRPESIHEHPDVRLNRLASKSSRWYSPNPVHSRSSPAPRCPCRGPVLRRLRAKAARSAAAGPTLTFS
jgi:hypothetical protein